MPWLVLRERGGANTNTGSATIVCNGDGSKLKAAYGHHVCEGDHAVFHIHSRNCKPRASDGTLGVWELQFDYWNKRTPAVELVRIAFYPVKGGVELVPPELMDYELRFVVQAGIKKALCYHCREPFYVAI